MPGPSIKELAELRKTIDELKEKGEDTEELEKHYKNLISYKVDIETREGGMFDFSIDDD